MEHFYHIFCCNVFVFACPIIARSQCWLFTFRANIRISVFALKYPYWPSNIRIGPQTSEFNLPYLRSGRQENMSKYKERLCMKSYFNQINTFQNIGIKFK